MTIEVKALRVDLADLVQAAQELAQVRTDPLRTVDRSGPELASLYGRIRKKRAEIERLSQPHPYEASVEVLECLANRDAAAFERRP